MSFESLYGMCCRPLASVSAAITLPVKNSQKSEFLTGEVITGLLLHLLCKELHLLCKVSAAITLPVCVLLRKVSAAITLHVCVLLRKVSAAIT